MVQLHDAEAFAQEALEAGAPDEVVGQFLAGEHVERGGAGVRDHLRGFVDGERAVLRDGLQDEVHHHLEAAEQASLFLSLGGEVGGGFGGDAGAGGGVSVRRRGQGGRGGRGLGGGGAFRRGG